MKALLALALATLPAVAYDPLATDAGQLETIELVIRGKDREVPVKVTIPRSTAPCPVILHSHGLGGSRNTSPFLAEHWAQRGYVAIFLQHIGSDDSLWRGQSPAKAIEALKRASSAKELLARTRDVQTVLDALPTLQHPSLAGRLDTAHIGISGHSFGAKTAQAIGGERFPLGKSAADPRVSAALILSPSPSIALPPQRSFGAVSIPWMLMTGTNDAAPPQIAPTTPADRLKVFQALPPGRKYELVLDGAPHSIFAGQIGPRETTRHNPQHYSAILALSTAFWDASLRDDPAASKWLAQEARSVLSAKDVFRSK